MMVRLSHGVAVWGSHMALLLDASGVLVRLSACRAAVSVHPSSDKLSQQEKGVSLISEPIIF